ncbi:MAG: hypothetical protein FJ390_02445 [Verrucomicrobia bacterium]|nr:hypothetical protein [Verrucomicrobiota bacterium]
MKGEMPAEIAHAPNSPETMDMKSSAGVNKMRDSFYAGVSKPQMAYGTVEAAKNTLLYPKQWASNALSWAALEAQYLQPRQ